jgi:hypothetical protein
MQQRVNEQLEPLKQNPALVRAFFKNPSVACISDL